MAECGSSVWGRVVDRAGNAVPDAVIYWIDPRPGDPPTLPRLRFFPYATTDSMGGYWASDLPPGPCLLVADREGLCVTADGGRWEHGTRLELPVPREPEVVLRFPHVPADFSRLRGTLSLPDKRPARDWTLALLSQDRPQPVGKARTDINGNFEMSRLPPGKYTLVLNGSAEIADANAPVELEGGQACTIRATLNPRVPGPKYSARAVCLDENGIPLAGVLVLFAGVNFSALPVHSGPDGVAVAEGMAVPAVAATGNLEGRIPGFGQMNVEPGDMPEVLLTLRTMLTLQVEAFDMNTGELIPRYNVHVHHEAGMSGDENGTVPRGIRGRGVMNRGRLVVVTGPCRVQVEAPGYEGAEVDVTVPPEGPTGPVKAKLRPRLPADPPR